jgi:hypothetical protein
MSTATAVKRYPLAALLKTYEWEERVLADELTRARDALGEQQRAHRDILRRISDAQMRLRELCRPNASFLPTQREIMTLYLGEQQQQAVDGERAVVRAQRICDEVLANMEAKRRQIKMLERHRERRQRQKENQQAREAFRAADELWILGRRSI